VTYLVSELRKTLDEEKNLARTDYLTTLNNSRHFYSLVGAEIQRSRRYGHSFSIAYLDIDNFKVMNDNFGHQTGDEVLVQVAETIKEHIRNTDIPGRLGGDEFAVFLPETDFKETNAVMRRLQDGLRNLSAERSWPATVSIGVASFERQTDSVDDIINLADNLMYSVKENGKNNIRHELYK
jgi:diguanylate cyclase (GGDEF)-like protein